jgi:hypothetical protein
MDAHDSVRDKVDAIFRELVGERARELRGDVPARRSNDLLGQAIAAESDLDPLKADELAFNLVDWNSDAAFLVAVMLFPERFTQAELGAGVGLFMVHVPDHVVAAARIGGYGFAEAPEEPDAA